MVMADQFGRDVTDIAGPRAWIEGAGDVATGEGIGGEWLMHLSVPVTAALVVGLNVPFGYWRARVHRFSRAWFLAVHLPVPLVVALRMAAGLGWRLSTFPIFVGAFCLGQWLGGLVHHAAKGRGRTEGSHKRGRNDSSMEEEHGGEEDSHARG